MERLKLTTVAGQFALTREDIEEIEARKVSQNLCYDGEILTFLPEVNVDSKGFLFAINDREFALVGTIFSPTISEWGTKWGCLTGRFDHLLTVRSLFFEAYLKFYGKQ